MSVYIGRFTTKLYGGGLRHAFVVIVADDLQVAKRSALAYESMSHPVEWEIKEVDPNIEGVIEVGGYYDE